jgi:predicted transcriptional regulator
LVFLQEVAVAVACINADGSLTASARKVLRALENPLTAEEIRDVTTQPLFRIRASLREMEAAGLVSGTDRHYEITAAGRARL